MTVLYFVRCSIFQLEKENILDLHQVFASLAANPCAQAKPLAQAHWKL